VVICGSADSVDEELWARQLGVWLYLPGVTEGDSLTSLCIEARRLHANASRALRPPDIHRDTAYPGNTADTTGDPNPAGAVADAFQIMKFKFTNAQYTDFLNLVAATDT